MRRRTGSTAVVAGRAADRPVDTDEIRALTEAAGYEVRGAVTQARAADPGTYFGRGKVADLSTRVAETDADLVAVDNELTPRQTAALRDALPEETAVFDRYRLVLAVFADRASARRAQLQTELARLRYDLPRLKERSDVQGLNRSVEKGTPLNGVKNRITDLERKLDDLPHPAEQHRAERREQGFDLVTLAGYTNAGKSTLLHRLADDLTLDGTGGSGGPGPHGRDAHPDAATETAAVRDRLFETLETTTRRATIDGRRVLCTDTVGFVADLPHGLVESFSETLSDAAAADAVVLVADASDSPPELREKVAVALDVLDGQGVDESAVVTALNKTDLLDDDALAERREAVADLAPDPVPVSVRAGTNFDRLRAAVTERLPTERAELRLPNCDEAMGLVSRAYDRAAVESVEYGAETVSLSVRGRPSVVEQLRADAHALGE
ncbi:GTP-binding proten HflX [Halosimplex carlsbadense 2-9-1]|uniref:GTPase HflX n=1 Tax=Halosimplex carlsbadense 2-9-1 TaxID=797114 RepID=M0CM06_9EURY|nr:GTPase HflX [Halosimplex carlsbadense]ELZ23658.1 GTP-binding proten HflX [Halosimplex carlsbadense 2-9-1]